jgi:hypothetical protein
VVTLFVCCYCHFVIDVVVDYGICCCDDIVVIVSLPDVVVTLLMMLQ